ncbi:phage/plasmid primase, P4 family [Streptococcus hyointestinalis]
MTDNTNTIDPKKVALQIRERMNKAGKISDNELVEKEKNEEIESRQEKLVTLRDAKKTLKEKIEQLRQESYDTAYQKALTQFEESEADSQEIEAECRTKAEKARKRATPKTPLQVARFLMRYIYFVRIKTAGHNQKPPLYFYDPDNGVYIEDEELLRDFIQVVNPELTEKQATEVIYKIRRDTDTKKVELAYTAFGNCLYNAKTEETQDFTPDIIVTRKIKTNFNNQAIEPNINSWTFRAWLADLFDGDDEQYRLAIQMIKASVTGSSLNNLFWLHGTGGTGKGTLQQLIINIVGDENIASLKINELHGNRFATSQLLGKSVVIGDDVQEGVKIEDTSTMFSLTTGDPITIEEKGKKPYSLRLNMTVIQSSNGFPNMVGDVQAIGRRFRVLEFSSSFKGKPNKAIKKDYINRQEVLEYVVRLALETPTEDIDPQVSQEILGEFQEDINPVLAFSHAFFTDELSSEFLPNSFVWYVWRYYLEVNNKTSNKSENAFHRELSENLPKGFSKGVRTIPAGREHHIGFNPASDQPSYVKGQYNNDRHKPEKCKTSKKERGYFTPSKKN